MLQLFLVSRTICSEISAWLALPSASSLFINTSFSAARLKVVELLCRLPTHLSCSILLSHNTSPSVHQYLYIIFVSSTPENLRSMKPAVGVFSFNKSSESRTQSFGCRREVGVNVYHNAHSNVQVARGRSAQITLWTWLIMLLWING